MSLLSLKILVLQRGIGETCSMSRTFKGTSAILSVVCVSVWIVVWVIKCCYWLVINFFYEIKITLKFQNQGEKWLHNFKSLNGCLQMYIYLNFTVLLKFTVLFVFKRKIVTKLFASISCIFWQFFWLVFVWLCFATIYSFW